MELPKHLKDAMPSSRVQFPPEGFQRLKDELLSTQTLERGRE